jgi:hypothetical protein
MSTGMHQLIISDTSVHGPAKQIETPCFGCHDGRLCVPHTQTSKDRHILSLVTSVAPTCAVLVVTLCYSETCSVPRFQSLLSGLARSDSRTRVKMCIIFRMNLPYLKMVQKAESRYQAHVPISRVGCVSHWRTM